MCGIAGIYCPGSARAHPELVLQLLELNSSRGKDASGIAWLAGTTLKVVKAPGPFTNLMKVLGDKLAEVVQSPIILLHARASTKGNPNQNENNHPIIYKDWAVVHNGVLQNDEDVFKTYGEPRFAEVDSAAIPLALEKAEGTDLISKLRGLEKLAGSLSVGVWWGQEPLSLGIVKIGYNPIILTKLPNGIFYFSSVESMGSGERIGSLCFQANTKIPDLMGFVLRPQGIQETPLISNPIMIKRTKDTVLSFDGLKRVVVAMGSKFIGHPLRDATKPDPDLGGLEDVLDYFPTRLAQRPKPYTLRTLYGRWHIQEKESIFKPLKGFKRWSKRNGLMWWKCDISARQKLYDGTQVWELLHRGETAPNFAYKYLAHVYVCPWCGAALYRYGWGANRYKCPLCDITVNNGE